MKHSRPMLRHGATGPNWVPRHPVDIEPEFSGQGL